MFSCSFIAPDTPVLLRRLMAVFHDGFGGHGHVAAGALIHGETASAWIQTAALLGCPMYRSIWSFQAQRCSAAAGSQGRATRCGPHPAGTSGPGCVRHSVLSFISAPLTSPRPPCSSARASCIVVMLSAQLDAAASKSGSSHVAHRMDFAVVSETAVEAAWTAFVVLRMATVTASIRSIAGAASHAPSADAVNHAHACLVFVARHYPAPPVMHALPARSPALRARPRAACTRACIFYLENMFNAVDRDVLVDELRRHELLRPLARYVVAMYPPGMVN